MSTWTITGATANGTPASLGLANFRRTRLSADVDRLTFDGPATNIDAALLFTYGEQITLALDSTVLFRGRIDTIPAAGTAAAEQIRWEAVGPWWWLEQIVYQQRWKTMQSGTLDWQYKSRVVLCQNESGARITTKAQIQAALAYAILLGAPLQVGTIDPEIAIPYEEALDITCAEVIRRMLRWSPDCAAWFDYATNPATLHIRRATAVTPASVALTALQSLSITPRYDLQIPGVLLRYEQTNTVNDAPYDVVTEDTAGDTADPRAFVATVELAGASLTTVSQRIKTEPIPTDLTDKAWWKAHDDSLRDQNLADFEIVPHLQPIVKADPDATFIDLPNILLEGEVQPWMNVQTQEQVIQAFLTSTRRRDAGYGPLPEAVEKRVMQTLNLRIRATDADTGSDGERTYSTTADSVSAEPVPTGLAAAIYAAWNRLQFDGRLLYEAAECDGLLHPGAALNITGGRSEWATMRAIVSQVIETLDTGRTEVIFGPARHLSPADLIALHRANRNRRVATGWNRRLSGRSDDDSRSVSLSGVGPVRELTRHGGETQSLIIRGDGGTPSLERLIRLDPASWPTGSTAATILPLIVQYKDESNVTRRRVFLCTAPY